MKQYNVLSSIRVAISDDKQFVKIDLIDKVSNFSANEEDNIFSTFILPTSSYQEVINALISLGEGLQKENNVDLGFKK